MGDWTSGYVADVEYLGGYYGHQEPGLMSLACLLNGFEPPDMTGGYSYCDLGCGFGETLLVLAAANPRSSFHGVDFNPAHVARAQDLARDAGLSNVTFYEADFEALAKGEVAALPMFDFIAAHGVYSWISDANQRALIAVLDRYAKPGAAVYLSYNSLPSSVGVLPVQWLLRQCADLFPGPSDQRFFNALGLLERFGETDARYIKDSKPFQDLKKMPRETLARYGSHEYLNAHWRPCFFADLARDVAAAKLSFAGSAYMYHSFKELLFTPEQSALMDDIPDPLIRETLKDYFQPLGLRRDVFLRGARRVTSSQQRALLEDMSLTLKVDAAQAQLKIKVPLGEASLSETTYGAVFEALQKGPKTLGELFALPELRQAENLLPVEVAGMLVGSEQACPQFHQMDAAAPASAQAYNLALTRRVQHQSLNEVRSLASPVSGAGLPISGIEPLVYLALAEGVEAQVVPLRDFVTAWYDRMGDAPLRDGKVIKTKAGVRKYLREAIEQMLEYRVPLWRRLLIL